MDGLYLIHDDGELVELTETLCESERLLQDLIARCPTLLDGNGPGPSPPRRWLLLAREIGLPAEPDGPDRWSLDHLFVDEDAVPTLVEVKRGRDTRLRRQVVGQMLDYAAHAVLHWPLETLRARFASHCDSLARDPDSVLAEFLGTETSPQDFWERVQANLHAGRLRMVFVSDEVPPELARVVEFLNSQMTPAEVCALEIRQFSGPGLRTLVPRRFGRTPESERRAEPPPRERRQWDERSFLADLGEHRNRSEVAVARRLLSWAKEAATRLTWGHGNAYGSFKPVVQHRGREHPLFAVWSSGVVEIYFHWYTYKPPFETEERRLEILNRLNSVPGISLPADVIHGLPTIPLEVLRNDSVMERFLETFTWMVHEILRTP